MGQFNAWGDYARLQAQADRRKLDPKAWAAEEQANQFIDAIANNDLKSNPEARQAWLENLATNRAKKHRRRAALLRLHQHCWPVAELSVAHDAAVANETVEKIKANTTTEEWWALVALSLGEAYKSLAMVQQCSESTLKTRISRCRKRLRAICA
jgi:DNA-directed RNA polymerase specialized sigma24 family protein